MSTHANESSTKGPLCSLALAHGSAIVRRATFWSDTGLAIAARQCFGSNADVGGWNSPIDIWDEKAADLVAFCELVDEWPVTMSLPNNMICESHENLNG